MVNPVENDADAGGRGGGAVVVVECVVGVDVPVGEARVDAERESCRVLADMGGAVTVGEEGEEVGGDADADVVPPEEDNGK